MAESRNIALFGGTFDPVHLGHLELARVVVEASGVDQVRFIPCRISPHKQGMQPAGAEDRMEMLRLATSGIPWAVVDGRELEREGPSYSYVTAREVAESFPGCRLFWIMGEDQWDALPSWKEPLQLASLVDFIVFARSGRIPAPREGYRAVFLQDAHPASATAIREAIRDGVKDHPWLHPDVARWIFNRGLYCQESSNGAPDRAEGCGSC